MNAAPNRLPLFAAQRGVRASRGESDRAGQAPRSPITALAATFDDCDGSPIKWCGYGERLSDALMGVWRQLDEVELKPGRMAFRSMSAEQVAAIAKDAGIEVIHGRSAA